MLDRPRNGTWIPVTLALAAALALPLAGAAEPAAREDGERLLFLVEYIGSDYGRAVDGGRVVDEAEFQEMLDFSAAAAERFAALPAPAGASQIRAGLDELREAIERRAEAAEVAGIRDRLIPVLIRELGLTAYPRATPSLERGAALYARACVACHGPAGAGDGWAAPGQDPPPSSFREPRLRQVSPHQVYSAITYGVEGTAMPSHVPALSEQDRWDVAFHVMTLREEFSPGPEAGAQRLPLRELAGATDDSLLARGISPGEIDHQRRHPPQRTTSELLELSQRLLDDSLAAYRRGDRDGARGLALDAYLEGVEPVEGLLPAGRGAAIRNVESAFSRYRAALGTVDATQVEAQAAAVREGVRGLESALAHGAASPRFTLVQSAVIVLREGVEATLLVGLLVTYLTVAGYAALRRWAVAGAAAGVAAGVVTWLVAHYLVRISPLEREAMEGGISLLAAVVLLSVCIWVIHHADIERWKSYIRESAATAAGHGRGLALASLAFLAVYREAFETVLFYEALWLRDPGSERSIVLGFWGGTVVLAAIVVLMFRFGVRLPLRPFFRATAVGLALLALAFTGNAIHNLQSIGWFWHTPLPWEFRVPLLEIHSTIEGCLAQLALAVALVVSWFTD